MNKPEPITIYRVDESVGMDDGPCGFHIWSDKSIHFARREDADAYAEKYPLGRGSRGAGRAVVEVAAFRVGDVTYLGELRPVTPQ